MKKNISLYISLLLFLVLKQFHCYIVYPLKTLEENKNNIASLLSFNSTYTILEVGNPPQEVYFYFDLSHSQINITDVGCINNNIYNKKKSTSFQIAFELELSDQDERTKYLVLDSLYFNSDLNLTKKLKIPEYPFYYSSDIKNNDTDLCGNIGISILQYTRYDFESEQIKYYTDELKKLGAGKYEDFSFFHYNNQDFLTSGVFLHTAFPDIFKGIDHISWVHPSTRPKDSTIYWEISMKDIYYNDVHSSDFVRCELNPLFELILGTNDFKNNITNSFFNSYINKDICSINEYKGFHVFECNAEKFNLNEIKKFPTIYLSNIGASHIFDLKSEELFIKIDKKWYFEIVFPVENLEVERWILGRIFMRKYPVIFSPFSRLIGFYIEPNEGKIDKDTEKEKEKESEIINNNSNSKGVLFYVIIVVIALVFTGVGLFLGKKIFYPRKKRANELLDDNYEYDTEVKKNENIQNNQNDLINDNQIN